MSALRKPSGTFRLTVRIVCWLFTGIAALLSVLCAIGLGVVVNRAPFNQLVAAWINLTIAFYVFFVLLVLASLIYYPHGSIEENAIPTATDVGDPADDMKTVDHMKSLRWKCTRKESIVVTLSFIMTSICVLIMTSFIYPEAYHSTAGLRIQKLGAVDSTSAKVFLRDASANTTHTLYYRQANLSVDFGAVEFQVNTSLDYTQYVSLSGLLPLTTYTYYFDSGPMNNFTTSPIAGTVSTFSFYFGSCFLYNVPGMRPAPGWANVDQLLSTDGRDPSRSLVAFIGDFIYSDNPWFKGDSISNYQALYRQTFTNPGLQTTGAKYPGYYMFDDHELINDWDSQTTGLYSDAVGVWDAYLGAGNPKVYPSSHYFSTGYGNVAMFFLDTRTFRSSNSDPDGPNKTMLGAVQKQRLFDWLIAQNTSSVFKFIVSTVGWTARLAKSTDAWGQGFYTERQQIFNFIRANGIAGCVFLSGDSHFSYGRVELDYPGSGLFEFSSSPLSAYSIVASDLSGTGKVWIPGNETVAWYSWGSSPFVSLPAIIDVDTTSAVPAFNVSFYDGTTLLYQDRVNATETVPR